MPVAVVGDVREPSSSALRSFEGDRLTFVESGLFSDGASVVELVVVVVPLPADEAGGVEAEAC